MTNKHTFAMMPALVLALPLMLVLSSRPVQAGGGGIAGNGGETVVCRDLKGNITSIELLDAYESRVLRNEPVQPGDDTLDVAQKLKLATDRIAARNPTRARRYQDWSNYLLSSMILKDGPFPETSDIFPIVFPKGCKIEQIAIQRRPEFPRYDNTVWTIQNDPGPRVEINRDLWNHLDASGKAAVVLHEVIYHEALHYRDVENAAPVRQFNALFLSGKVSQLSDHAYLEYLRLLGFGDLDQGGIDVTIESQDEAKLAINQTVTVGGNRFHLAAKTRVRRFDSGAVRNFEHCWRDCEPGRGTALAEPTEIQVASGSIRIIDEVEFRENGQLAQGTLYEDASLKTPRNWTMTCKGGEVIRLTPAMTLAACSTPEGGKLLAPNFELVAEHAGIVEFSEAGIAMTSYHAQFGGSIRISSETYQVTGLDFGFQERSGAPGFSATLTQPARLHLRGVSIELQGQIGFRADLSRVLQFQPASNFLYHNGEVELPVAAYVRCGLLWGKKVPDIVSVDDNDDIIQFMNSMFFTPGLALPVIPSGKTVKYQEGEYLVVGDVCNDSQSDQLD